MGALRAAIEHAIATDQVDHDAVFTVIEQLDLGKLRVAEPQEGGWRVHAWVKRAILMYFRITKLENGSLGDLPYRDRVPLKTRLEAQGIRVVPPGAVRYGAFLEPGCVVMPGYVNIGAYVGAGSMVDTWATVGSCAQIGAGVHLSGGVGIGGVLEPAQAAPVIIEDGAFIGSRCVVVEGVRVRREAVLGAGLVLTASTPILDVTGPTERMTRGEVPERAILIPGTRVKSFPAGSYQLPCALLIGYRSESTDRKTSLNDALREHAIAV